MKNNKKTLNILTTLLIIVLIFSGCNFTNEKIKTDEEKTIKIGMIAAITGAASFMGTPQVNGAKLAIEELKAKGYNIELIIEDSPCDPATATKAFNKLVTIDKIEYLVGPSCSFENAAIGPMAENYLIPIIALGAQEELTHIGDYTIPYNENPIEEGKLLAQYANKKGYKNAGSIYFVAPFTIEVALGFKEGFTNYLINEEITDYSKSDFRDVALKAKEKGVDAIYINPFAQETTVIKQFLDIDYDGLILFDTNGYRDEIAKFPGAQGRVVTLYPNLDSKLNQDFEKRFIDKYGKKPSQSFSASLAYDAIYEVVENLDIPKSQLKVHIMSQNHVGASGKLTYVDNQPIRDLDVYGVQNGQFVKVG